MRRHLNTLYISTQGCYLSKEGECVKVNIEEKNPVFIPIHTIGGVVCFGNVLCSPFLLGHCAENGVSVSFLSENGRFLASVRGPVSGNVLLRREQYRRADDVRACTVLARAFVMGKTFNARALLRRSRRDGRGEDNPDCLSDTADCLTYSLDKLERAADVEIVRGLEGEAAARYFGVFDALITRHREFFHFSGRKRRPPPDPVNALLSFLYTLLMHDVRSALEGVGLDPSIGFLHSVRPGRFALALDMMEEFRSYIADRLALTLVNRGQCGPDDFIFRENGAVSLTDEGRKRVLVAYQERKKDEVRHPFLNETTTVGLLWHIQAQLLARYFRGDLDGYPPFAVR